MCQPPCSVCTAGVPAPKQCVHRCSKPPSVCWSSPGVYDVPAPPPEVCRSVPPPGVSVQRCVCPPQKCVLCQAPPGVCKDVSPPGCVKVCQPHQEYVKVCQPHQECAKVCLAQGPVGMWRCASPSTSGVQRLARSCMKPQDKLKLPCLKYLKFSTLKSLFSNKLYPRILLTDKICRAPARLAGCKLSGPAWRTPGSPHCLSPLSTEEEILRSTGVGTGGKEPG